MKNSLKTPKQTLKPGPKLTNKKTKQININFHFISKLFLFFFDKLYQGVLNQLTVSPFLNEIKIK